MITYVDNSQAELYTKTFAEAQSALRSQKVAQLMVENPGMTKEEASLQAEGIVVDSIEAYIQNLPDLMAISPKYTRLPVDEEVFEIDANARKITVPAAFTKNGVGVTGDEMAEIVYFKINRFFDIMDFGTAVEEFSDDLATSLDGNTHIIIQWQAANGEKGFSKAYAVDKDTDNNHIYFGWALTRKNLTKKAGNITFNVRIFKFDAEGNLAYSFSTQNASISVKAGLDFDITDDAYHLDAVSDAIHNRLIKGNIAHAPIITSNLSTILANINAVDQEGTQQNVLKVEATPFTGEDDAIITYKWYHDGELMPMDQYYSKAITVDATGEYYVVVLATRVINTTYAYDAVDGHPITLEYHTSTSRTQSNICQVPAPVKLEIRVDLVDRLIMEKVKVGETEDHKDILDDASLYMEVNRQVVTLANGDKVKVGDLKCDVYKTADATLLPNDEAIAEASYSITNTPTVKFGVLEHVDSDEEGEQAGEPETRHTVHVYPDAEGYYKLLITNKLNNSNVACDMSKVCRVTYPAAAVENLTIVATTPKDVVTTKPSVKNGDKLTASFTQVGSSDELNITWYVVTGAGKDPEVDGDQIVNDDEIVSTEKTFTPNDNGDYYFIVVNKLNGTEATSVRSEIITVNK